MFDIFDGAMLHEALAVAGGILIAGVVILVAFLVMLAIAGD